MDEPTLRMCCWTNGDGSPCTRRGSYSPELVPRLAVCHRHRNAVDYELRNPADQYWLETSRELHAEARELREDIGEKALRTHLEVDGCDYLANIKAEQALLASARKLPDLTFVYYVACGKYVKIGRSRTPARRLGDLRRVKGVICPEGLRLEIAEMVRMEEAPPAREAERHRQFAHLRAEGEWFHKSAELGNFMRTLPKPEHYFSKWSMRLDARAA